MSEQWYTNKELFEQINHLSKEMQRTQRVIEQYNGLRQDLGHTIKEVDDIKKQVNKIEYRTEGKENLIESILKWLGLAASILSVVAGFGYFFI